MIQRIFYHLTGFLVGILLAVQANAGALAQTDLKSLVGEDFSAKQVAIKKVLNSEPVLAATIFQALQDETLFGTADNLIVIKTPQGYIDAIDGKTVVVDEANLSSPTLNNSLRADVEVAASQFKLLSKDEKIRSDAINALMSDVSQVKVSLVKQALENETDAHLKSHLQALLAIVEYPTASKEIKLAGIKTLGLASAPQAAAFLSDLIKKNDNDNYVEADSDLRHAAEIALKDYKTRKGRAEVVANIFTGLSLGSILLLAALGLAITYGLIGVINMAHGEFLMIGAYATYIVQTFFRAHFPQYIDAYLVLALPFAFICAAGVGLLIEYLVLRHLYGRPLETLLATFGISLLLMQTVRFLFGAQNVEVANPVWMSGSFAPLQDIFPGLLIPLNRLVIFNFAIAVVVITWLVLNKTRLGLFVRAVTQNRSMAACVGVKTRKIDSYAFAFGAGIAGLGGCALSQIGNVGPDLGQAYIIDSFMAVVLGGVGQLAGTILGAFGLGILSKFTEPFIGAVLTKIGILILIILFIQKRPQGIFAMKGRSAEA